jgi:predicted acyltransferase
MNAVSAPAASVTDSPAQGTTTVSAERILAIDAFRGLTILVMIFVNTLAGVRGMPAWMEHMPADVDGMTFVDVVFPAFLFIVGMSIPFALAQREAQGDTPLQLWKHIGLRALGLIVLGVFMVNAEEGYNERAMPMSIYLWSLLFYGCAIMVWSVHRFEHKAVSMALRLTGIAGLVALAVIFRGGEHGDVYLAPQWWGILGLIGWAYLIACFFYRVTRGRVAWLLAAVAACTAYYCIGHIDALKDSSSVQLLFSQSDDASHASIVLSGLLTSLIFFGQDQKASLSARFARAAAMAAALFAAGAVLRPYFRISKIYATPTWCLYSAAICIVLFALLYWIVDLKKIRAWTRFFKPAASNPLLTYIIPYIVYAWMQYMHWALPDVLGSGAPGLIWAASYAIAVMLLVVGLNRLHIKLQL